MFVNRYNDDHIRVAPCCQAQSRLEPVEGFDFRDSPYLQELRAKFGQGLKPSECSKCWDVERLGHKSRRQSAIEFFDLPDPSEHVILESIDYSATWACNLACIMCGEINSSSWAKEIGLTRGQLKDLGRLFQKNNSIVDRLDTRHVKKIHFNGGEPMLNDDQYALFKRLDDQGVLGNVFASYNTNGTVMPSDKIIDLWARARLIKLFFSVDATDRAFEYVRYPGKWEAIEANILTMKENLPDNVIFGINVTVGTYNVLELKALREWFNKILRTNRAGDPSDFCWQFAYNYDPIWLLPEAKQKAIEDLVNIEEYQGIVSYLSESINYIADHSWTQSLDKIDRRRGTSWRTTLSIGKYY